ncbi:L10-interacting MYB domain-containing protein-like [Tripterygium wilfordii]|nr:L10-interacting MYB domain-containing protein-like [Tripterygium wilfordii]
MDMDSVPSEDQSKQDQSRAKWTDKTFVDLLIEQMQQNSVSDKRAWKHIREEFNKRTGLKFGEQQLRNHQSVLRRLHNNIKSLLDQNSFSWNDALHMVIDDDEVWNSYVKAYPEADAIRGKECPIFKQLCILFSGPELGQHRVEGGQVQPSHNTELDQDIISMGTPEVGSISAEPIADEGSSHLAEEGNISDGRNKRRNVEPISSRRAKRIHMGTNCPARVDATMTCWTDSRVNALPHCPDQFSISNCIKVLNRMQGIDQYLYLAASDIFLEPDKRETFISIKNEFRLAWLKAKCQ